MKFSRLLTYMVACFMLFATCLEAQIQVVDSLKQVLATKVGKEEVQVLNELALLTRKMNARESLDWSAKAQLLATKKNFQKEFLKSQYAAIEAYCQLGYHDSVFNIGNRILPKIQDLKMYELEVPTLLEIGKSYWKLGDWKPSLDYANQAAKIAETLQNPVLLWHVYKSLGILYYDSLNEDASDQYVNLAYEQFNLTNDRALLPEYYYNYALDFLEGQEFEAYLQKAIQASKALNDNSNLAYAYHNLGVHLLLENRLEEAISHFIQGLKAAQLAGDHLIEASITNQYGKALFEKEKFDSAIILYEKAIEMADWEKLSDLKRTAYYRLANVFEIKGNHEQALESIKKGDALSDSLFNKTSSAQLSEAHARYENEKQQLEIARQKNARNQIIFGGLALLLLITGIFQWYFYNQGRKKKEAELALYAQQKEAERLRHLDTLKTNFFTNISHELRTPLTLILAPLENAIQKVTSVGVKKDLELAQGNSKKLLNLVNEILDLAKLESGKLAIQKSEIALRPLVRRIFYSYESIAHLRKLQLDFYCPISDELKVGLDTGKFEKILNNLLANAIKFSEQNGVVTLRVEEQKGIFHFEVRDTGKGIHPGDLPHIFDRFYQSTVAEAPLQGGSGIGLALAKELAELMEGNLEVESELRKGSVFRLSLPFEVLETSLVESSSLHGESEEVRGEKSMQSSGQPHDSLRERHHPSIKQAKDAEMPYHSIFLNGNKPKILIVEDNTQMSQYLEEVLSKNFICTTASDGRQALEKLKNQQFDLITSDVMMPFMDGFAFREKLNEHPEWQHTPFILLTARALEEDKLRGFRLGIDDYITKPFNVSELQARIQTLLQNKMERETALKEAFGKGSVASETTDNAEKQLLLEAEKIVLKNLDRPDFKVKDLAHKLGYSQRNLTRVLKKLTGFSPVLFILEIKLQKARQLLENRQFLSVTEVRYEVGIESASYFTKKFSERFGRSPSSYLN